MPKAPSFPMYARDWLIGTAGMSPAARGVYIDLLCYQWINGSIPADEHALAQMLRIHPRTFAPIWAEVQPSFELLSSITRANQKLERCRKEADEFAENRRKAANSRWHPDASADALHMPASASASASSKEQPPTPLEGGDLSLPSKPKRKKSQQPVDIDALAKEEQTIVRFWQQQCQRKKSTPNNADLELVRDCLKDTALAGEYEVTSERMVCLAIKGCSLSDFHMGREPGKPARHNDLSLIFRDAKHIRMFVDIAKAQREGRAVTPPANGFARQPPPDEEVLRPDPEERFVTPGAGAKA